MTESLCNNCLNCESAYKFNGSRYVHEDICAYDLSNFGRAKSCPKYETTVLDSHVEEV
jgi:hypothetical protein